MWKLVVLFCVLAFANGQQSTAVSQCVVFSAPLPIHTYIEGCTTPPCLLPQLQDAVINIVFRAPHTIRRMRTLARALLIGNIGVDHPLEEHEETCNFLTNTYCPILKDEVIAYTLRMFVEPNFFVGAAVTIEFRIVDENDTLVTCLRVPVRIVAAVDSGRNANSTLLVDTQS